MRDVKAKVIWMSNKCKCKRKREREREMSKLGCLVHSFITAVFPKRLELEGF